MLMGPYAIFQIDTVVTLTSPGVYLLSKDGNTVAYVGRSDNVLSQRLKQSITGKGYSYFWFEYTTSAMEAYHKECEYYHRYNPRDNSVHPAVPFGTNWKCPVIGCPFS